GKNTYVSLGVSMKPFLFLVVSDFVCLLGEPVVHSHIQDISNFELAAACSPLKACFASRREAVAIDFGLHALQCSAFGLFLAIVRGCECGLGGKLTGWETIGRKE